MDVSQFNRDEIWRHQKVFFSLFSRFGAIKIEESGAIKTKYFVDSTKSALSALSGMYSIISDHTGFLFLTMHQLQLCIVSNILFILFKVNLLHPG